MNSVWLPFAGGGGEQRRIDQREAVAVEEAANFVDQRVPHAQDRPGAPRAEMQMPMPHEEIDAVRLGRDRIAFALADRLQAADLQLVPAFLLVVGLDQAGHAERSFLAELLGGGEERLRLRALGQHALAHAAAVANDQELDLPLAAAVVEPALQRDGLADVMLEVADEYVHGGSRDRIATALRCRCFTRKQGGRRT